MTPSSFRTFGHLARTRKGENNHPPYTDSDNFPDNAHVRLSVLGGKYSRSYVYARDVRLSGFVRGVR